MSTPHRELAVGARRFLEAAEENPLLKRLLLVDPIRAFSDAGIELSKGARKLVRSRHPETAIGNEELYLAVQTGEITLSLIGEIELDDPDEIEEEPDPPIDPDQPQHEEDPQ